MDNGQQGNGRDLRELVTQQTYDSVAPKYAHTRCGKGAWQAELQHFSKMLQERGIRPKNLLDVGCGSARVLSFFLDQQLPIKRYVGLDYSNAMLEEALAWNLRKNIPFIYQKHQGLGFLEPSLRQRLQGVRRFFSRQPRLSVDLVCQRMQDMDPPEAFFDVVTLCASLHHLLTREDQETVLELCAYSMRPGALLCMTNWRLTSADDKHKAIWEVPFDRVGGGGSRFYYAFLEEELTELLLYAGFSDIQHVAVGKGGNIVTTAVKD